MSRHPTHDSHNAGAPSSPFFQVAALLMAVLNLVLGSLSGWFHSPLGATSWQITGHVLGHAVGWSLGVPAVLLLLWRLVRGPMDRRTVMKRFFFLSVGLFPLVVVSVTAGVVDRLHIHRALQHGSATGTSEVVPADAPP